MKKIIYVLLVLFVLQNLLFAKSTTSSFMQQHKARTSSVRFLRFKELMALPENKQILYMKELQLIMVKIQKLNPSFVENEMIRQTPFFSEIFWTLLLNQAEATMKATMKKCTNSKFPNLVKEDSKSFCESASYKNEIDCSKLLEGSVLNKVGADYTCRISVLGTPETPAPAAPATPPIMTPTKESTSGNCEIYQCQEDSDDRSKTRGAFENSLDKRDNNCIIGGIIGRYNKDTQKCTRIGSYSSLEGIAPCAANETTCNPLIFGLKKSPGTPFCVAVPFLEVTENCSKQSGTPEGTKATQFLHDFENKDALAKAWDEMVENLENLCKFNGSTSDADSTRFHCKECGFIYKHLAGINEALQPATESAECKGELAKLNVNRKLNKSGENKFDAKKIGATK